jgi:hypothetical protein
MMFAEIKTVSRSNFSGKNEIEGQGVSMYMAKAARLMRFALVRCLGC